MIVSSYSIVNFVVHQEEDSVDEEDLEMVSKKEKKTVRWNVDLEQQQQDLEQTEENKTLQSVQSRAEADQQNAEASLTLMVSWYKTQLFHRFLCKTNIIFQQKAKQTGQAVAEQQQEAEASLTMVSWYRTQLSPYIL